MTYVLPTNNIHLSAARIPSSFALSTEERATVIKYLRLSAFSVSSAFLTWLLMATDICEIFDAHFTF
jgi:hypothetical protein